MKLVKGTDLNCAQRQQVLRAFVHRRVTGSMPYVGDDQWLVEHAFYLTNAGRLALRPAYCEPAYMAERD